MAVSKSREKGRMKSDGIKFVTGQPAALVNDTLVIADLHIGVEYGYYKSGIRIPSNTMSMLKAVDELLSLTGAKKLVMLGDVKHKVPGSTRQELREIPEFLAELGRKAAIDITPGNHDSDLKNFLPESVRLHPSSGFAKDGFFFLHGHAWPDEKFLKADYVLVGHEHPQIEFRDKLGHRFYEQVWIRAELDREKLADKYGRIPAKLPELIMVPKFNRLSGGISMNYPVPEIEREHKNEQSGIGALVRSSRLRTAKVYMLDGTFLGELKDLF